MDIETELAIDKIAPQMTAIWKKIEELQKRIDKLETGRIAEAEDTYKKGSGRYL